MPRDRRSRFLRALQQPDGRVYRVFLETMAAMANEARLAELERAIERQDVGRVLRILNLTEAGMGDVRGAIQEAFGAGASYQNGSAPKALVTGLNLAFDGSHPRIAEWMQLHAGAFISEMLDDQRIVVRETLVTGLQENRGYAAVARDLVGRREGNQRKGGLVGLHSSQVRAVKLAREQLQSLDLAYLRRSARDKRFDRTIAKAVREGRPLAKGQVDKITRAYAGRLLRLRARTIARTEGNRAMNAGRSEAIQQMVDSGRLPAEAIQVFWDATPGPRTRDSHRALNGQSVAWGERFVSPVTGAAMLWPYDETAPAEEVVNCRCSARFEIDWKSMAV